MKGKKTGGIQKGFKYPKTLEFKEKCDENGFVIVDEFIKLFRKVGKKKDKEYLQLAILQEMAKYQFAIPRDYGPLENPPPDSDANQSGDKPMSMDDILALTDVTPKKEK